MDNANDLIVLNVKAADKQEYVEEFRNAVFETLMLLFERRELDLGEAQLYGLHRLVHAAISVEVKERAMPGYF